jgi:hypothetical protein
MTRASPPMSAKAVGRPRRGEDAQLGCFLGQATGVVFSVALSHAGKSCKPQQSGDGLGFDPHGARWTRCRTRARGRASAEFRVQEGSVDRFKSQVSDESWAEGQAKAWS